MEKVRIAFVGVGNMGQMAHLRNYASLPDCEIVALAELRPQLGARVAARYGIPKVYPDADSLLAAEKVDGIVAAQPFDRHGQVLPALYATGVPVFSEKPLAASLEVGERLIERLSQSGSWHMVGYHKRCDPATVAAKAEIDRLKTTGALGAMRYVRITMPPGDWIAGGFNELTSTNEPTGPLARDVTVGWDDPYIVFVNYYIHQVNLLRHLLGEPYRVLWADPAGVLLAAQSASGVTATIEMAPYSTSRDWQESALVCFERGWVKLDLPAPLAHTRPGAATFFRDPKDGEPQTIVPTLPFEHAMRAQARAFVRAIRGDAPPPCEAQEALEDLKVARDYLALKEAA